MEVVILRYNALQKALTTLDEGLEELELSAHRNQKEYKLMRDGIIQRFEYCIDSFWKFLKVYLENNQQLLIESPSPKSILRLSASAHLVTDNECIILLDCVSDRNLTSHTYNEEIAEKIQSQIPLYYETMQTIVDRLKQEHL